MRRLRPLVWFVPVWLLLAACSSTEPTTPVRSVLVMQPGGAGQAITAYAGEVHAREEPPLAFRIGGKIARRLVDAGARVKAGQALAELDAKDVDLQRDAARAAWASAKTDLALAKAERDRYQSLLDRQLVSRSLFDAREASYRAAVAQERQARSQAAVSGNQSDYATLRAPHDGVIAQRLAEAGQVVAAGQPVFVLAVDGPREVAINLPEQDIARFKLGREMLVELWSAPGRRFRGQLRELAAAADPQTRTYAARVSFDSEGRDVDLGQSARVYAGQRADKALAVPLAAIVAKDDASAVWVVRPKGKALVVTLVPVVIGPYGESSVPVLSGLRPDDWVVAAGAHLLREGQPVQPVDRHDRVVTVAGAVAATAD